MNIVAGAFNSHGQPTRRQPRDGTRVPFDGGMSLWTLGYRQDSVHSSPALGGTSEIVAVGECLATDAELRESRDAAERGNWAFSARLPGAYLSVVRTGTTVRVIGDRAGTHLVYWVHDGDEVLWATSSRMLAAVRRSRPDTGRLLARLTLHGVDPLGEASFFNGVRRVQPGRALVLEPGQPPHTQPVPSRHTGLSMNEGARELTEHLTTAVHRRVEQAAAVSADLSGGVDSSAIASLAAARRPLLTVTYTDQLLADQDDVHFARRIADSCEAMTHVEIDGTRQGVGHFDGLEDASALPLTDTPSLSLGLLALKREQLGPAAAYGSRLHLTGRGGDNVLDSIPMSLVDLGLSGGRLNATSRLQAFARARRAPVHAVLAQALRTGRLSYSQALALLAADLRDRPVMDVRAFQQPHELLTWCGPLASRGWLTAAGSVAVAEIVDEAAHAGEGVRRPGVEHERIDLERMGEEHGTYDEIARQRWGLPVHAPYLDAPVVDACLAIPGWERWKPGDFKPLARKALGGSVPDFLLNRRTKTPMTGSTHRGLRANAVTLRAIISGSALVAAGLINPASVLAALDSAARGERAPLSALHQLIVTELWLATLSNQRIFRWETTDRKAAA
ncbi:albusnodin/ikarugamycin family macrolactam cyclase [Streptomyces sp. NPDC047726]|uniref:albusnodin/ikarugamycin family macrolactam cyclase n=1 Tax=Streptomyces sp. NPDC047726 TaxID=3156651 RepID=UPI0033EE2F85